MWFGRPFVTLIIVNKLFEVVSWTILVTIVRLFCSEFNYYKRVVLLGWCNTHHSFCTELVILWYFAVEIMLLLFSHSVVVIQSLSCVWLFVTPWTAAFQAFLSFTISQSLLRYMSIESVMPSNCLILCYPLLLLPSVFPSIRVFFDESALRIRWPKYWSFSFSISPSNEYSGLISQFRIDWFDLLAVQGIFKSLLQHNNSKVSILSILYSATLTSIHD